jgi:hypothetical protein
MLPLPGRTSRWVHCASTAGSSMIFRSSSISFFARLRQEDHVAIERHVVPLEQQHDHQGGHDVVLVVDGATSVHVTAVTGRAERGVRPFFRVHVDHVGVAHDEERPLAAVPLQPRDEVGAIRFEREHLDGDAFLLEDLREIFRGFELAPGRIAGVEAQQRLKVPHRLFLGTRPIRLLDRLPAERALPSTSARTIVRCIALPFTPDFALDPSPFTLHLHPSPFTLHPSPFTLHPSPFTLPQAAGIIDRFIPRRCRPPTPTKPFETTCACWGNCSGKR